MDEYFKIILMVIGVIFIGYASALPVILLIKSFKLEKIKDLEYKHELEKRKITQDMQKIINEKDEEINNITELYTQQIDNDHAEFDRAMESIHFTELSFNDINEIIDDVFNEIWVNKYLMNYTIRGMVVIPNMDEEITYITKDVYDALSENVKHNILRYYPYEYFIKKITRRATIVCADYIKQNKPPIK